MPLQANIAYGEPNIGAAAQNLGLAIFGDPNKIAQDTYYRAHAGQADAAAAENRQRIQLQQRQYDATSQLGATLSDLFKPAPAGMSPAEWTQNVMSRAAPYIVSSGGGNNPDQTASAFKSFAGTAYALPNDQGSRLTSMAIQGKDSTPNSALTPDAQTQIAARNAADENRKAFGVANINQSGDTERAKMKDAYDREYPSEDRVKGKALAGAPDQTQLASVFQPHNTPADSITEFAPGDPRATGPQQAGELSRENAARIRAEAKPQRPPMLHARDQDEIDNGVSDALAPGAKLPISQVLTALPVDDQQAYRDLTNQTFQQGGGTASAIGAGSRFLQDRLNTSTHWFGGPTFTPKQAPAAPAPGASAAFASPVAPTAGNTQGAAPAPQLGGLPPATQRQQGQQYQTPAGSRTWTGTGWVTPDQWDAYTKGGA